MTLNLRRDVESLSRLLADDRMPANRERLAEAYLSDLMRQRDALDVAIEALQDASAVTDTEVPEPPVPVGWTFKNSPSEMLAEIAGTVDASSENIMWVQRGSVHPQQAARQARRARAAWRRIDQHLRSLEVPVLKL